MEKSSGYKFHFNIEDDKFIQKTLLQKGFTFISGRDYYRQSIYQKMLIRTDEKKLSYVSSPSFEKCGSFETIKNIEEFKRIFCSDLEFDWNVIEQLEKKVLTNKKSV